MKLNDFLTWFLIARNRAIHVITKLGRWGKSNLQNCYILTWIGSNFHFTQFSNNPNAMNASIFTNSPKAPNAIISTYDTNSNNNRNSLPILPMHVIISLNTTNSINASNSSKSTNSQITYSRSWNEFPFILVFISTCP